MSVSIRNLSHVYSQNSIFEYAAIKDISLDVGPHDFIGIIGHTGSGKSSFIQHLNRLLIPRPVRSWLIISTLIKRAS
jgi:energy-coupling factor transport system ATP-binding protein